MPKSQLRNILREQKDLQGSRISSIFLRRIASKL
nr:MAG TPA: hypothetical protein [Caudoviricetes sp.]